MGLNMERLPLWILVTSESTIPIQDRDFSKLAPHPEWITVRTGKGNRAILGFTTSEKAQEHIDTNGGEGLHAIQVVTPSDFIDTFDPLAEQGLDQIALDAIDLEMNPTTIQVSDALAAVRKKLNDDISLGE